MSDGSGMNERDQLKALAAENAALRTRLAEAEAYQAGLAEDYAKAVIDVAARAEAAEAQVAELEAIQEGLLTAVQHAWDDTDAAEAQLAQAREALREAREAAAFLFDDDYADRADEIARFRRFLEQGDEGCGNCEAEQREYGRPCWNHDPARATTKEDG